MKNEDAVRLFDLYSDDLFRFAVSYVGSKHDAEDIVQEVFLKLLGKHIPIIRSTEKTYLMTITANMCKDHLRSSVRKTNVDLESAEPELLFSYRIILSQEECFTVDRDGTAGADVRMQRNEADLIFS